MIDPITFWNGQAGARWAREQAGLDAMLRAFGEAALEDAGAAPGERVIDVGCGCGDSSLLLADLVGSDGRVVGLDVSAPMLARARERSRGRPNLSFIEGDASSQPLAPGGFDLLYSRFGVMFFVDPAGAFAHLRGALRANGRLAFVCWQPLAKNPWATVPLEAAVSVLGRPEPEPADGPGPFSFGDRAVVERILEQAGFRDVTSRAFEPKVTFGESGASGGSGSIDDAVNAIARLGPVARLLVDREEADVRAALLAIKRVLPDHWDERGGARFASAAWVVSARRP
jgi:SAM-dependent methyltransferase